MKKNKIIMLVCFFLYVIVAIIMRLIGNHMNLLGTNSFKLLFWGIVGTFLALFLYFLGVVTQEKNKTVGRVIQFSSILVWIIGFFLAIGDMTDFLLQLVGLTMSQ